MKVIPLLVVVSLAANAALFFFIQARPSGEAAKIGSQAVSPGADSAASTAAHAKPESAQTAGAGGDNRAAAEWWLWSADGPDNLRALGDRLRAAGFPDHVTRVVLRVQMDEYFTRRRKAMFPELDAPVKFWDVTSATDPYRNNPEKAAALRGLRKEYREMTRELLGAGTEYVSYSAEEYEVRKRRQYGDMPAHKVKELDRILADYGDMRNEINAALDIMSAPMPDDRAKLALLEKEQRADIEKLLTPAELEEYNLRSSATARSLASRLSPFKPTEEEFRAIFKLQHELDSEFGAQTMGPATQNPARQAKQREINEKIMAMLPPERAADFKLASDPALYNLSRIAARFNIPSQSALSVADVQKQTMQQFAQLLQDKGLPPAEMSGRLDELKKAATEKMTQALGPKAFEVYREYGGQWLDSLRVRRPGPAPKS